MKRFIIFILVLAVLAVTGCVSTNVKRSAFDAGLIGAGVGAILDKKNSIRGALIGGAAGAVIGGTRQKLMNDEKAEGKTKCQKIVRRRYVNGHWEKSEEEICRGQKENRGY